MITTSPSGAPGVSARSIITTFLHSPAGNGGRGGSGANGAIGSSGDKRESESPSILSMINCGCFGYIVSPSVEINIIRCAPFGENAESPSITISCSNIIGCPGAGGGGGGACQPFDSIQVKSACCCVSGTI